MTYPSITLNLFQSPYSQCIELPLQHPQSNPSEEEFGPEKFANQSKMNIKQFKIERENYTLEGFVMGKETRLESGLEIRPLQIKESDGARGMAKACAIFFVSLNCCSALKA